MRKERPYVVVREDGYFLAENNHAAAVLTAYLKHAHRWPNKEQAEREARARSWEGAWSYAARPA